MQALIAGGGIGGLVAALALAATHEVTVLEQAPLIGEAGAGIQLSPNATRVLFHLGLEAALAAVAFRPLATEMRQWRTGRLIASTPLGEEAIKAFGYPYFHVHRGDLIGVLEAAVRAHPRIRLYTNARVRAVQEDRAGVDVDSDAGRFTGDLLVGADGIRSLVRTRLFGAQQPVFTGNVAWRLLVPAGALPDGMIRPAATAWWGPGGHVVHYFVRRGELVNCVFIIEQSGWEVESWTEAGNPAELQAAFARWHPDVRLLASQARTATLFKWALFDRPPMAAWGRGRITLLGDACHATLPFMAQGAAMAIEDAIVLAGCLGAGEAVEPALQRYERLRKGRTAAVQTGSRRNATVFHLRGIQAWLRNRAAGRVAGSRLRGIYAYDAVAAANGPV